MKILAVGSGKTITEALKGGLKMTIDEAIKWHKDKEAEYRYLAKEEHKNFAMIAEEYQQFAEWLMELKDLREENKFLISEFDRLIKEKGEQIAEYERLLKSAVNILKFIPCDKDYNCGECIKQRQSCDYDDRFKWRYLDEALKLINDKK